MDLCVLFGRRCRIVRRLEIKVGHRQVEAPPALGLELRANDAAHVSRGSDLLCYCDSSADGFVSSFNRHLWPQ
jgi:hypothetical protein